MMEIPRSSSIKWKIHPTIGNPDPILFCFGPILFCIRRHWALIFPLDEANDDPSGLPFIGNNKMETLMGPSIISIFDFLLNDHYAQVKSTLRDLFRRSTSLNHGNHSPSTLKTSYCTVPIVQTCRLNPLTQDSDPTGNALLLEIPSDTAPA